MLKTSRIAALPRQSPHRHFVGRQLFERPDDRFERALDIRFDHDRQLFRGARGDLREHLLEGAAAPRGGGRVAAPALTEIGDLAGPRLVLDDDKIIAGERQAVEAERLDRGGGTGFRQGLTALVDESAHPAPFAAGDKDVADAQGPALHQHGGDRAAAAFELGLEHHPFGRTVGVGAQV